MIRVARTSTIFALPWTVSVTIPACEPVSEIASWPRSWIAIAQSAFEIRSPTEMSMSYSRGCGRGEISWASRISSSVVSPIAERTPTTRLPASRARDEPARDVLDLPGVGDRGAAELHHDEIGPARGGVGRDLRDDLEVASSATRHISRRPDERAAERDLVGVLEVAADGEAAGEPRHAHAVRAAGRRGRPRSPRRSCSGSSRARPPPRRSL